MSEQYVRCPSCSRFTGQPMVPKTVADELADAVDDYSLWEPGRAGHAMAHTILMDALVAYRQSAGGET